MTYSMVNTVGRFLPRNLKFRLTSVVVVLVLAAAVLVTLVALALAERDMKAIIGDQQYALLSSAAAVIDDRIETRKLMVAALADTLPAEVRDDPARVQAWLVKHVKLSGYFLNVAAFDPAGTLIASLVAPSRASTVNVGARPYFQRALVATAPVVSAPIRSALSGAAVVLVSVPVRDAAGKVALVLVGGIDLQRSSFLPEIDALKPGKTGFIFIMTTAGILIEHPDKSRLLEHVNTRPGDNTATARALDGFEGWTESVNRQGVEGIYSFKRLKATEWIVGARYPTDEAFAPMIVMRRHAVLGAAGLAALAGLLAWLAINGLLAPLETLRRHVAEIRAGRAGIEVLRVRSDDEIGELGTAFHQLMAEREAEKARSEERISAGARRARIIADSMPALIAYVDREQRYEFTNAHYRDMLGIDPAAMIGRTVREMMGAPAYAKLEPQILAALRGERVHFEHASTRDAGLTHYMIDYLPDVGADGSVAGFYLLALDITRMKDVEERLMQLARSDSLTGIANRRMFGELLPLALERARRHDARIAIAYLDIDHFKQINDSFGHAVGDEVLCEFARRLLENVRAVDTVARLSGDEFVIIFEDVAGEQEAQRIAVKLIEAVRAPFATARGPLRVSTSVGVAIQSSADQGQEALLANADQALYQAKREGRDRVAMYRAA